MTKKKGPLNVSLDSAWVEHFVTANERGEQTFGRTFHKDRDERLQRAHQNPAESRIALWCGETYKKKQTCNVLLAEVYATSEGDLWEARMEGPSPYDLELRKMFPSRAETTKSPAGLHAHNQWLDSGEDDLVTHCKRHGRVLVKRSALAPALAAGTKHAQIRDGHIIIR